MNSFFEYSNSKSYQLFLTKFNLNNDDVQSRIIDALSQTNELKKLNHLLGGVLEHEVIMYLRSRIVVWNSVKKNRTKNFPLTISNYVGRKLSVVRQTLGFDSYDSLLETLIDPTSDVVKLLSDVQASNSFSHVLSGLNDEQLDGVLLGVKSMLIEAYTKGVNDVKPDLRKGSVKQIMSSENIDNSIKAIVKPRIDEIKSIKAIKS